jgi:hypothetical protein
MELSNLIESIKRNFHFLNDYGFQYESFESFNQGFPDDIAFDVIFFKKIINNNYHFFIQFHPRAQYHIYVYMYNDKLRKSLSLSKFFILENKIKDGYINKEDLDSELKRWAVLVEELFNTKLQKVITGEEWISLPYHDPRDDY